MIDADIKNDILNECMSALGQPPLSTPDNPQGYIEHWAVNRLQSAIEQVLAVRPWSGTFDEAILTKLSMSSLSGAPRYQLPQNCVRVNFVRGLTTKDWRQSGRELIIGVPYRNRASSGGHVTLNTNLQTGPHVNFNSKEPRVSWGADLRAVMGLKLALKIHRPNENSTTALKELKSSYMFELRTASAVEGAAQSGYVWREDLI